MLPSDYDFDSFVLSDVFLVPFGFRFHILFINDYMVICFCISYRRLSWHIIFTIMALLSVT